jgi:hypothetical protein
MVGVVALLTACQFGSTAGVILKGSLYGPARGTLALSHDNTTAFVVETKTYAGAATYAFRSHNASTGARRATLGTRSGAQVSAVAPLPSLADGAVALYDDGSLVVYSNLLVQVSSIAGIPASFDTTLTRRDYCDMDTAPDGTIYLSTYDYDSALGESGVIYMRTPAGIWSRTDDRDDASPSYLVKCPQISYDEYYGELVGLLNDNTLITWSDDLLTVESVVDVVPFVADADIAVMAHRALLSSIGTSPVERGELFIVSTTTGVEEDRVDVASPEAVFLGNIPAAATTLTVYYAGADVAPSFKYTLTKVTINP